MKKNRLLLLFLCLVLCAGIFAGCGKQEQAYNPPDTVTENTETAIKLDVFPMNMIFASGAGGWRTQITLKEDGTFVGDYYDSELGSSGPGYEYTAYICEFSGKYEITEQIDDYSYSLKFTEVIAQKDKDTEWIEDSIKYIYSEPYGVYKNTAYVLYTDKTPVETLSDDVLMWWPNRYNYKEDNIKTLSCYALYNETDSIGFFSTE